MMFVVVINYSIMRLASDTWGAVGRERGATNNPFPDCKQRASVCVRPRVPVSHNWCVWHTFAVQSIRQEHFCLQLISLTGEERCSFHWCFGLRGAAETPGAFIPCVSPRRRRRPAHRGARLPRSKNARVKGMANNEFSALLENREPKRIAPITFIFSSLPCITVRVAINERCLRAVAKNTVSICADEGN